MDEPVAYLWTLLVDDVYEPGLSGGRKVIQVPSFHSENDGIIREVEGRWRTKVVEVRKSEPLFLGEADDDE